jgi:hypothetical protein
MAGACPGRTVEISTVDLNRYASELSKLAAHGAITREDPVSL